MVANLSPCTMMLSSSSFLGTWYQVPGGTTLYHVHTGMDTGRIVHGRQVQAPGSGTRKYVREPRNDYVAACQELLHQT